MDRRTFLQKSSILLAGLGTNSMLHPAILRAFEIAPDKGSTFYDAEHIVILMQENRSFDHAFGCMKGVRGFKDKKSFIKSDGLPIFFQKSSKEEYAIPSRLDIKNTKATWMHDLPHSWKDQILARNEGKNDMWLKEKASGHMEYSELPLTLGYYNREDLPFYYQLADAFTICDQYFCSSLTGTTPNRMFLWSGTIREEKNGSVKPNVYNEHIGYERKNQVNWKTFPELLEEHQISWRIYQNEISLPKGMNWEEEAWLSNFTDNPLEWMSQYNVKFSPRYYEHIPTLINQYKKQISEKPHLKEELESIINELQQDLIEYHPDNFKKLSAFHQNLHNKAFTINDKDPYFGEIQKDKDDDGIEITIPKGDVLYQFREDVEQGKLPAVSWLIAPQCYSDHPSAPWYGAWYISEVMNILTKNPEIWKKTIFIINYDENDGYFDHVLPFTPPNNPSQIPDMNGEDGVEFLDKTQVFFSNEKLRDKDKVEGPIGLGYRVPMIIASPWTRGGFVNSEVSDHTSVIQFLEKFIAKKYNKNLKMDSISKWRRAICGDLTSCFHSADTNIPPLDFIHQKEFSKQINSAKNKPVPTFKWFKKNELSEDVLDVQEKGTKPSYPLPYHFLVNLEDNRIVMRNLTKTGVPLIMYNRKKLNAEDGYYFSYTLFEEQQLEHHIEDSDFDFEIFGPNGFYRRFVSPKEKKGDIKLLNDEEGKVHLIYKSNDKSQKIKMRIKDFYTKTTKEIVLKNEKERVEISTPKNSGWYDILVEIEEAHWYFAGRAENGKVSISDPHWA